MIVKLPVCDLSLTKRAAESFFLESELPGELNFEYWKSCWESLINTAVGVIFAAQHGMEVVGMLGGLCFPCTMTGQIEIVEMFWYVMPEQRNTPIAIRLLRRFEEWGMENGACRIKMIHLVHLNSDKVEEIYHRMGYQLLEKGYYKNL